MIKEANYKTLKRPLRQMKSQLKQKSSAKKSTNIHLSQPKVSKRTMRTVPDNTIEEQKNQIKKQSKEIQTQSSAKKDEGIQNQVAQQMPVEMVSIGVSRTVTLQQCNRQTESIIEITPPKNHSKQVRIEDYQIDYLLRCRAKDFIYKIKKKQRSYSQQNELVSELISKEKQRKKAQQRQRVQRQQTMRLQRKKERANYFLERVVFKEKRRQEEKYYLKRSRKGHQTYQYLGRGSSNHINHKDKQPNIKSSILSKEMQPYEKVFPVIQDRGRKMSCLKQNDRFGKERSVCGGSNRDCEDYCYLSSDQQHLLDKIMRNLQILEQLKYKDGRK